MEIKKFREAREEMIDQPTPEVEVENQEESPVEETELDNDQMSQSTEGVANPNKLNEKAVSLLTDRIKDEYTAHYFYRAAANWCFNVNYKKAAAFFDAESSSELEHAKGLQKYMDDWNVMPQIPSAPTEHNFNGGDETEIDGFEIKISFFDHEGGYEFGYLDVEIEGDTFQLEMMQDATGVGLYSQVTYSSEEDEEIGKKHGLNLESDDAQDYFFRQYDRISNEGR